MSVLDFWNRCEVKLVPDISDGEIEEMLSVLKPVAFLEERARFRLIETDGVDRRDVAYTWGPKLGRPVQQYLSGLNSRDILTLHRCGYYGFFKPSLAEALASIRAFCLGWRLARFWWLDSRDMDAKNVLAGGTHQWCRCVLFGPEQTQVRDPEWEAFQRQCASDPVNA